MNVAKLVDLVLSSNCGRREMHVSFDLEHGVMILGPSKYKEWREKTLNRNTQSALTLLLLECFRVSIV